MEKQQSPAQEPRKKPPLSNIAGMLHLLSRAYSLQLTEADHQQLEAVMKAAGRQPEIERLGEEHFRVFGRDVFLWHSFYTSEERMIGGAFLGLYGAIYHHFEITTKVQEADDHLATILEAMAIAAETHNPRALAQLNGVLGEFWPFILQLLEDEFADSPYATIGLWTDEVLQLCAQITEGAVEDEELLTADTDFGRESLEDFQEHYQWLNLDDDKTGLKDIATFFATPATCGIALSPRKMQRFARTFKLPIGFGSRIQLSENLIRSAADYKRLQELFQWLEEEIGAVEATFKTCKQQGSGQLQHWGVRWHHSRHCLSILKEHF